MKFLVAIALLTLAVAEANHVPEHTLRGPRFKVGNTYKYDAVLNVTAGVLGLSSQVSASVLRAEVKVQATSETEHVLKIENVRISGSVPAIDNKFGDIPLRSDGALEDRLSSPIKFTLVNGKVTKYTMSRKDNMESRKIKKSILRSLEMHVPQYVLVEMERKHDAHPIMYNHTENTEFGVHISNYIVTVSPDVEFPAEKAVYNISRVDNYEGEWYPGHMLHHNFQKQGCPEVCRQTGEWKDNMYGSGCPSGFEPHHTPIKRSFTHEHSLSPVDKILTPEIIKTVEVHFAKMYDQDMEVLIRYHLKRTEVSNDESTYNVESGQTTHEDLHKMELEINEDEIDQMCDYKKSDEAMSSAENLLRDVAELIVKADPTLPIGEKIILLKDVLSTFTVADFEKMAEKITKLNNLQFESNSKSVARQVWLEMLPLIGTTESVKFIVKYIRTELMDNNNMLVWEVKEMLESLPLNIDRSDEEVVREMEKLLNNENLLRKSTLLHSTVHMAMGRIIGEACGNVPVLRHEENEKRSWLRNIQRATPEERGLPKCPENEVHRIIEKIGKKLRETERPEEIAVYVEALTHTGVQKALWEVIDYAHGSAKNMKHFSPRHMSFMRTAVLHALHNIVGRYPEQVLEVVFPIYFNQTETPKIRNAAFGVLMRCQPSLAILEKVATYSWSEQSLEVGSFVTSTLESFGNSTLPCMQLLSHRIKEILPQVKRFNIGMHHAKNHMWTYFDDLRQYGLEGRMEYTPNNESFIPSTFYHSLSYTMESLKDTIFQSSLNIEGLTQDKMFEMLIKYLDIQNIQPLSTEREIFGQDKKGMYFMQPRTVEGLRLVTYQKMFYKMAYYYLDINTIRTAMEEFSSVFEKYLKKTESKYSGHLVKVFLPSNYHTVTVAKTLPYPVEFQMRQPIVVALEVKTSDNTRMTPSWKHFDLHFKPSIHVSKIFTHHMKNLGDCKEVGVYHTHKIGMVYPFEIKYDGFKFPNITFKYKMPEMMSKVLYYWTESGTYAGKKELEVLPMAGEREPIRTLPTPFKFVKEINLVGIPPFRIEVFTEDLNLFHQKLPRTPTEFMHMAVKNVLNAGWRYKSANITLLKDRNIWTGENEATFKVEYSRIHVPRFTRSMVNAVWPEASNANARSTWQQKSDEYKNTQRQQSFRQYEDVPESSWRRNARESDDEEWNAESPNLKQWGDDDWTTASSWRSQKQSDDEDWNTEASNVKQWGDDDWTTNSPWESPKSGESGDINRPSQSQDDDWTKYMEPEREESLADFAQNAKSVTNILNYVLPHITHRWNISITAEPLYSTAYLLMEYNHTYDKNLHLAHVKAVSKRVTDRRPYVVDLYHMIGYFNKPDEMRYDRDFGKQVAYFRTALDWPKRGEMSRPWEKMEIAMNGYMNYTSNKYLLQHKLWERVDDKYFMPETYEECRRDVKDGKPLSPDCIKAMREHSVFNRLRMNIQWDEELPQCFKQYARIMDVYMKHYFFEHLHLKTEENKARRMDVVMEYIDKFVDEPLANWEITKPSETVIFKQIPIANLQPFSSIYPMHEAWVLEMTNNSYPARCVLSENYVQTYDLVTYPFTPENCNYVLTAHCTKNKNFAVILRENKEIHIHVASTKMALMPPTGRDVGYLVKFNERDVRVVDPVVFDRENEIYAYIERYRSHSHIKVVAKKAGINVVYDGKTVKVQVSPRYKGELCGLCSEFDGEEVREFIGMDRCLYRDPIDFANSAMIHRSGKCDVSHPRDERICEDPKYKPWRKPAAENKDEPNFERNVVIYKGDEVCFSIRPVSACHEDQRPTEVERQRVGFHCLPKDDITAKKMITEAKWRPLNELRRKSVDHVENIEVPKQC